jgi:TolB-like protein
MEEENKDERIENLEEKVTHLSRMLVKSFGYAEQDPDTFLQNARRTTEAICRFLYIKEIGEPKSKMMLNDLGRELMTKKIVPDRIGILIGTIQTYGNYAAHAQDDLSETTREWIAPCQTALASLTNWFFLNYLKGNIPDELASTIKNYSEKVNDDVLTTTEKSVASRKSVYVLGAFGLLAILCIGFYLYTKDSSIPKADTNNAIEQEVKKNPKEEVIEKLNEVVPHPNAKRIAIIYFDGPDDNAELNRLRKGLADMLISDLSKINMLNVIERSRLEEILKEQKLNNSKQFDATTASRLGKLLGVEYMLTGSYFEMMGKLRIDARIIQVETGKIMKSEGVDGDTPTFFNLEKQLMRKIATGLEVDLPTASVNSGNTSKPITYEASMQFSDGLEQMDRGNAKEALIIFDKVLANYPDFTPAKEAIQKLRSISL